MKWFPRIAIGVLLVVGILAWVRRDAGASAVQGAGPAGLTASPTPASPSGGVGGKGKEVPTKSAGVGNASGAAANGVKSATVAAREGQAKQVRNGSAVVAPEGEEEIKPLQIPVPPGQTVKGIKIPYFDLSGKLRMQFFAEEALRVDENSVQMARLRVELFGADGKAEDLVIDLPASRLDLRTQVLTSTDPVLLQRSDFSLEGQGMEFDTRTRKGVLRGKVRMQIFDRKKL